MNIIWRGGWHAESNPPSVLAAFIFADYLCFIQDSSAAFVLASRGIAVSPFISDVHPLSLHIHPSEKHVVSAPVSCFSADALWHHGSV